MNQYEKAMEIATEHFKNKGEQEITAAYEYQDRWIFFGGIPGMVNVGGAPISIMKDSMKMEPFRLPSRENFDILKQSKVLLSYEIDESSQEEEAADI